jgi:hypothetical protein
MSTQQFALYMMIAVGGLIGLASAVCMFWPRSPDASKRQPLFMAILALAFLGVGAYGPSFLGDYAKFLTVLRGGDEKETETTYKTLIDDIASGEMPAKYQPLFEAYMLEHPIDNLGELVDQGVAKANGPQKESLLRMKETLSRKEATADLAAQAAASPKNTPPGPGAAPPLHKLDSASLVYLRKKSPAELEALRTSKSSINTIIDERKRAMMAPH